MKTALVLIINLFAWAHAKRSDELPCRIADMDFLEKQKDVIRMVNYIIQPTYYRDFLKLGINLKFEEHWDQWRKPEYAKEFWNYYQGGLLPRGEIFTVFNPIHLQQAIALFRTLYYAKDYDMFHQVAAWARNHVNQGMFLYAYYVAVFHSPWTQNIILPAIHEVFPFYFFGDDVIQKAQHHKANICGPFEVTEEIEGYIICTNYSDWRTNYKNEGIITYFTEDIGLNSQYFYYHIMSPTWLPQEESTFSQEYRGTYFYWMHHQVLARYYLERLSNSLGEMPSFAYDRAIIIGHYPSLAYPNDYKFPYRPSHSQLEYKGDNICYSFENFTENFNKVKEFEKRLEDVLEAGQFYTSDGNFYYLANSTVSEGLEILGNLIESNIKSLNSSLFGDIFGISKYLVGYSYNVPVKDRIVPSTLEHFATSMRDPAFYQILKRIMNFFYQYQNAMGPYEKEQLYFEGIKIEDVNVSILNTFFNITCDSDLSKAVHVDEKEFLTNSFNIHARQPRLDQFPFTYKINVTSDKNIEAFIKVFIGPKKDNYGRVVNINRSRLNYFELDRFKHTINIGENIIERNSGENQFGASDPETYNDLYKRIVEAMEGKSKFKYYHPLYYYGFPNKLLLPKGRIGGQTFRFYAIIAPFHNQTEDIDLLFSLVDKEYSLNYPFDRPIENEPEFLVPNSYIMNIKIYHM